MPSVTTDFLEVPGARLYYEVQGSGPLLVFVGHPMGAGGFGAIATQMAGDHTVVTYDPRGFGRSTIDDRDQDAEPDLLADDARRLLEAVGGGPAHVVGSSGGAITGLALVARHPDHVATFVAHEPPVVVLLPDAEEAGLQIRQIYDAYGERGLAAAWEEFAAFTHMRMVPPPGGAGGGPPSTETVAMSERFFLHGLLPIALYQPDLAALRARPGQVVPAGGRASGGELARRTAAALAEHLGAPLVEFPGGHAGFATDAADFAVVLRRTLQ